MKKLIITSAVLVSLTGALSYGLTRPGVVAEDNTPIRVDQLEDRVDNHEARITNTEHDVTTLQENTNTQPSQDRTPVPDAPVAPTPQQSAPPSPQPAPVVVIRYEERYLHDGVNCFLTYSNNTTSFWKWKSIVGGVTTTTGVCDDSLLGTAKV